MSPQAFIPITSLHLRATATSSNPVQTSPILRPSSPPAWDSALLTSPVIKPYRISTNTIAHAMWYTSSLPDASSGQIGLALSDVAGKTFTRVPGPLDGPVLRPNNDDWWAFDTGSVDLGDVLLGANDRVRADAGVYFMYYTGTHRPVASPPDDADLQVQPPRRCIGLALSKDGEHFTRIEGDYPSGAILEPGAPGSFDELFVSSPCVTRPSVPKTPQHSYIMHYYTFDNRNGCFAIGRAISKDGILFRRDGLTPALESREAPFAARGVSRCSVVERAAAPGRRFVMLVEVVDEHDVHRIAMSESDDCENWQELVLVLSPAEDPDAWDGAGISHPCAVEVDDGRLRLYYVGHRHDHDVEKGRGTCIGLAESDGPDWTVLHRVSGGEGP